jgi:hypothetical protein
MHLSAHHPLRRLPKRFRVGTTYVVEGYGGELGDLRVTSRYLVLPSGRRISISDEQSLPVRTRRHSRNLMQTRGKTGISGEQQKIAVRGGTPRPYER